MFNNVAVLIWYIVGSNGSVATYSQEFKTMLACEKAREALTATSSNITAICCKLEQYDDRRFYEN